MRYQTLATVMLATLAWALLADAAPPSEQARNRARVELPGKPAGPISVEHRMPAEPAVGVPLAIAITARVEGAVGALSIDANASSPRAVLVTPPLLTSVVDGVYTWSVTVVPLSADAGYLSVIVSGSIDRVSQAGSVTLSLRSATAPDAAPSAAVMDGETLIALPVQESP